MRNFYGWSLVALACMTGVSLAQATRQDEKATRPGATPSATRPGATPSAEAARAGRADEKDRAAQPERTRDTGRSAEAGRTRDTERSAESGRSAEAGRTGSSSMSNQQIAALIHGGCRNEIEISKFAMDRLKSPEAKEFAAKMVRDHEAGCEKVAQIAGSLAAHSGDHGADATRSDSRGGASGTRGATEAGTRGVEGAAREGTRREGAGREGAVREGAEDRPATTPRAGAEGREDQPRGTATAPGSTTRSTIARAGAERDSAEAADTAHALAGVRTAGTSGAVDWVSIHKQMADQCLTSTRQELGRYQGDDFDKAYMGQQLVAHMKMADELKVLRNHATGELKQEIEKGIQMANTHLEDARRIMHQEKDEGSTTERPSTERASREGASSKTEPRESTPRSTTPRTTTPKATNPAPRTTPAPRDN